MLKEELQGFRVQSAVTEKELEELRKKKPKLEWLVIAVLAGLLAITMS